MNLNQLKYFQAVCLYQTVSAAAAYLHISQPTLSSAIKELESEFGLALFRRQHSGMVLTEAGELLRNMSRELLVRAEQIETVMHGLGKENKKLRLGVPPMIGYLLMPRIYSGFLKSHPDIRLEITEGGRQDLLKMLSDDFLDIVFLPHNRPLNSKLEMQKVMRLEIVCCASRENPIAGLKTVCAADLAASPLILFKDSFFQTEEIRKWFAFSGVEPKILLQTNQFSTMQTIISSNAAVGFLFKELLAENAQLVPIPIDERMYVDVSLAWKKDSYIQSSVRKLISYFGDFKR